MESEKVKEIKEVLEVCDKKNRGITILCGGEIQVIPYADILTLINELESENEWLVGKIKEKINEMTTYTVNNQQLKDRIAELEKSKFCVNCTKEIQGREVVCFDCHEEVIKCAYKQFAERLKEKLSDKIGYDRPYVMRNIDETLKEFIEK